MKEPINYQSTIDQYVWREREIIARENSMAVEAVKQLTVDWLVASGGIKLDIKENK